MSGHAAAKQQDEDYERWVVQQRLAQMERERQRWLLAMRIREETRV